MVYTVTIDWMSHHCDPEHKGNKPIFLHDTLAHDDAWSYQVWLQVSSWGDIIQMNIHWKFEPFLWPWQHNRTIQSFYKKIQLMMSHQSKFSCKRISSSEDILKSHILIILSFSETLNTANQSFWKTIWLTVMHHHTKFGSKRFSNSEDIIWTNIHWNNEILLWHWP